MISFTLAIDWRVLAAVMFALVMFGFLYNLFVGKLGSRKDGYVSFLVVVGVLATLLAGALISWQAALLFLALFASSGPAMIIGDIHRYVKAREQAKKEYLEYIERYGKDMDEELTGRRS